MRFWRAHVLISVICAATGTISSQHGPFGRYTGPKSLGTYTREHAITKKSFLAPFAPFGAIPSRHDIYCISDKKHGLFLHASVDAEHDREHVDVVFISSFPNCKHLPVLSATIDPAIWKTPEGVGIGSTKQAVLKAYGHPQFSQDEGLKLGPDEIAGMTGSDKIQTDLGDSSYVYSCMINENLGCGDLRVAQFGLNHGKVIWISMRKIRLIHL